MAATLSCSTHNSSSGISVNVRSSILRLPFASLAKKAAQLGGLPNSRPMGRKLSHTERFALPLAAIGHEADPSRSQDHHRPCGRFGDGALSAGREVASEVDEAGVAVGAAEDVEPENSWHVSGRNSRQFVEIGPIQIHSETEKLKFVTTLLAPLQVPSTPYSKLPRPLADKLPAFWTRPTVCGATPATSKSLLRPE